MRKGFKPYNKRKPFKRKSGGGKYFLGGKEGLFPKLPEIPNFVEYISNLFSLKLRKENQRREMN